MQFDKRVVGQVLKQLRKEKGVTQEVLSGLAGIARTHLTMIENGKKQPNFETIWRLAYALDMTPSGLVAYMETAMETEIPSADS